MERQQFESSRAAQPVGSMRLGDVARYVRATFPTFEVDDRLSLRLMPGLAARLVDRFRDSDVASFAAFARKLDFCLDDSADDGQGFGASDGAGFSLDDRLTVRLKFGFAKSLGVALSGESDEALAALGATLRKYTG
jgi:hypothetical protein